MPALLAIDLGTEAVRVGVFDTTGVPLASAAAEYQTSFPRPGWAEQQPEDWWAATVRATRQSVRAAGSPPVTAISVATTSSTVAVLDSAGKPLRPAILWMDCRARREAALTAEVSHPVLAYSGGGDAVEWLVPKAMWLAANEPDVYRDAASITEAVDYLTWKLTGQWTASRMNACCKWNYDPRGSGFVPDIYAAFGVPDLIGKLPQRVLPVGAPAGELCQRARKELGLTGPAVVAEGGIDAHLSLIVTGRLGDGEVSVVAGTSTAFITETERPAFQPTIWGPYPDALRSGRWLTEGGQTASGSVLRWVRAALLPPGGGRASDLVAQAAKVPPASHGLLLLDYFMGNRTPRRDAGLRGAVLGLTLGTTSAQIYRAAVEGVAYGTRSVLESFVAAGMPVERITLSGGIRNNDLWLQTTADVLGRPLFLAERDNLTLRACAALAGAAGGHYATVEEAAAAFAPSLREVRPDQRYRQAYDAGYDRYLRLTAAAADVLHELAESAGDRGAV